MEVFYTRTAHYLQMSYKCPTSVLQMSYKCPTHVMQVFYKEFSSFIQQVLYSKCPTSVLQMSYKCPTTILYESDRCPYLSYWLFAGVLRSFGALSYPCVTYALICICICPYCCTKFYEVFYMNS